MVNVQGDWARALEGRYEVECELGQGGMACVYLARDIKHERHVAIKVLRPELARSISAERFLREINIAARLTHPHILPLLDSVAVDDVLCYVMPYVTGETLRRRLEREGAFPLEDALLLARQVADALEYAHQQGIVHRDIKPENILLVGNNALVADFGLARAISEVSAAALTESGIAVGTPGYMAPEQGAGDPHVDGRADQYSLACVLYEMIAGEPPFRATTVKTLLAQHATQAPPPLCASRENCPPEVEAAVHRALAKAPADRYRTSGEFLHAIDVHPAPPGATRARWTGRRSSARVAVLAASVALLAIAWPIVDPPVDPPLGGRYVILPFAGTGGRVLGPDLARQRVYAAFRRWRDLDLVDLQTTDHEAPRPLSLDEDRAVARRLRAGRFVTASVARVGDSVQVRATLYDTDSTALREAEIHVPDDGAGGEDRYRQVATALLRVTDSLPDADDGDLGTTSLSAWRAYSRAQAARRRWDLDGALRELRAAVAADPRFAQAQLWLAQVGAWAHPEEPREWREAAGRAVAFASALRPVDTLLAHGVAALGAERYGDACAMYAAYRQRAPREPTGWFGLAQCQDLDSAVVRDAESPSGWRFRSSDHGAVQAYVAALDRADGAPEFAFRRLERLLRIEPWQIRIGRRAGSAPVRFGAYPVRQGDSIAFIPYPEATFYENALRVDRSARAAALRLGAARLATELQDWARRAPRSAEAHEALARVQEVRGELSAGGGGLAALQTLATARRHATSPQQRFRLAVTELRLLVKDWRLADARALADSLLRAHVRADTSQARLLAGVAALTGRTDELTRLLQVLSSDDGGNGVALPGGLGKVSAYYAAHAALGVCTDSLRRMPATVEELLLQYVVAESRDAVRRTVLTRPLSLAAPCLEPRALTRLDGSDDLLVRMQRALALGQLATLRAQFDTLRRGRLAIRPGDVDFDRTYLEAWLLARMGDTAAAVRQLDLPLTAPSTLSTRILGDAPQAAAIGRAMVLRAELAAAQRDEATARRWARHVVALWETASPALQPTVGRMRALAAARMASTAR